jgi:hypothetical protein
MDFLVHFVPSQESPCERLFPCDEVRLSGRRGDEEGKWISLSTAFRLRSHLVLDEEEKTTIYFFFCFLRERTRARGEKNQRGLTLADARTLHQLMPWRMRAFPADLRT